MAKIAHGKFARFERALNSWFETSAHYVGLALILYGVFLDHLKNPAILTAGTGLVVIRFAKGRKEGRDEDSDADVAGAMHNLPDRSVHGYCPKCGVPRDPEAYFCSSCGERYITPPRNRRPLPVSDD